MKRFLLGLVIALSFVSIAAAANVDKAKELVDTLGKDALRIIDSKDEIGRDAAQEEFRKIVNKNFDIKTISRFTLGRYWKAASKEDRKEFTSLIQEVILNKYADRILDYQGEAFTVTDARAINDKDVVVNMTVKPDGNPEVSFSWRTRKFGKKYKIIDLSIEGVSMSITHRNEFSGIIQREGGQVSALIEKLAEKKE